MLLVVLVFVHIDIVILVWIVLVRIGSILWALTIIVVASTGVWWLSTEWSLWLGPCPGPAEVLDDVPIGSDQHFIPWVAVESL